MVEKIAVTAEMEARVLRRLIDHLRLRTDVQNIDLMGHAGFCRNCLGDWLHEAAAALGAPLDRDSARAHIYGMPYADFKARHQAEATPEQIERMNQSLARNASLRETS